MKFIEPKNKNSTKVDWDISERVRAVVKYYAAYTEYSESKVVDMFLLNVLDDEQFLEWIASKRNNKRHWKSLMMPRKIY